MAPANDSAVTAAELDEADAAFWKSFETNGVGRQSIAAAVEAATVGLRKQLTEARAGHHLHDALRRQGETIAALMADNAKKDAALRFYANEWHGDAGERSGLPKPALMDDGGERARAALTPASQEAPGHTDLMVAPESIDAFMEANPLPEDAPASPSPGFTLHGEDLLPYKGASKTQRYVVLRRAAPASPSPGLLEAVKALVDRFLTWKLPDSVRPDPCASMPNYPDRTGTNLLTASEAEAMLRHVLDFAACSCTGPDQCDGECYPALDPASPSPEKPDA